MGAGRELPTRTSSPRARMTKATGSLAAYPQSREAEAKITIDGINVGRSCEIISVFETPPGAVISAASGGSCFEKKPRIGLRARRESVGLFPGLQHAKATPDLLANLEHEFWVFRHSVRLGFANG